MTQGGITFGKRMFGGYECVGPISVMSATKGVTSDCCFYPLFVRRFYHCTTSIARALGYCHNHFGVSTRLLTCVGDIGRCATTNNLISSFTSTRDCQLTHGCHQDKIAIRRAMYVRCPTRCLNIYSSIQDKCVLVKSSCEKCRENRTPYRPLLFTIKGDYQIGGGTTLTSTMKGVNGDTFRYRPDQRDLGFIGVSILVVASSTLYKTACHEVLGTVAFGCLCTTIIRSCQGEGKRFSFKMLRDFMFHQLMTRGVHYIFGYYRRIIVEVVARCLALRSSFVNRCGFALVLCCDFFAFYRWCFSCGLGLYLVYAG